MTEEESLAPAEVQVGAGYFVSSLDQVRGGNESNGDASQRMPDCDDVLLSRSTSLHVNPNASPRRRPSSANTARVGSQRVPWRLQGAS